MTRMKKTITAALIAVTSLACTTVNGMASAFVAWRVTDIASDDVLMVRAYPSASSRILVGYPNDVMLSMTGRCTGNVKLHEISGLPEARQRHLVDGKWCEIWLDPHGNGEFRNGWVYGKYIEPVL